MSAANGSRFSVGAMGVELDTVIYFEINVHMHGGNCSQAYTPFSDDAQRAMAGGCACFQARRRARNLARRYDEALAEVGLTSSQFSLIAAIAAAGEISVQNLADIMDMDHSSTSRGVQALVRAGMLGIRQGRRDKRRTVLQLTEDGRVRFNAAAVTWSGVQDVVAREG